jgi:uncharacterized protein DUF4277
MATYQSQVLDHLGLVAGMFNELGIREVIDRTIPQDMTKRTVSLGQAVKAMVLNGLGFVNQQLYLVPSFSRTNRPNGSSGRGLLPPISMTMCSAAPWMHSIVGSQKSVDTYNKRHRIPHTTKG